MPPNGLESGMQWSSLSMVSNEGVFLMKYNISRIAH